MTAIDKPSYHAFDFPSFAAGGFGGSLRSAQRRTTASSRTSDALLLGILTAAEHQSALRQDLMRETVDDLVGLGRARSPQEFLQAEMSMVQRYAERSLRAIQAIQQEMLCCSLLTWRAATDDDAFVEEAVGEAGSAETAGAEPNDRAA
jgi:hypothetical protein